MESHGSGGKVVDTALENSDTKQAIVQNVSEDERNEMQDVRGDSASPWTIMAKSAVYIK